MEREIRQEQILVRITGQDRPGLTASIMGILAKYDAQILDIGQADIHSTLSLGILIRMDETNSGQVMKELLFKATELNVNIGFSPISDDEYEDWVGHQGKNRYILMVLGRQLEARQIEGATRILADQGLNIDSILRLTGRKSIKTPACIYTRSLIRCYRHRITRIYMADFYACKIRDLFFYVLCYSVFIVSGYDKIKLHIHRKISVTVCDDAVHRREELCDPADHHFVFV